MNEMPFPQSPGQLQPEESELRQEIDALRDSIRRMEQRIETLEQALSAGDAGERSLGFNGSAERAEGVSAQERSRIEELRRRVWEQPEPEPAD